MSKKYSLLSADEPTDEELHEIMADALIEVKKSREKGVKRSKELLDAALAEARERSNKHLLENG